ncbi:PadR family transcriptional regulator [Paenibacillus hodogayensis]|uniref:PadR family transcriptional regulator n=1 Tax=Paenibacillus hodogayensis TaxID=279208 RepID=A0ABV5W0Z2_9BACL
MKHGNREGPGRRGEHCRPGGGWEHGDWGGSGRRFFGRGYMKFALLELLEKEPMHGYQMMKALEEKSDGHYTPSAGSIYPTLQMLDDRGWIESDEAEGKKIYRPTKAGLEGLEEWRLRERKPRGSFPTDGQSAPSAREKRLADGFELIRLLTKAERRAAFDPAYAERVQRFVDDSLRQLRELLRDRHEEGDRDGRKGEERRGGTMEEPGELRDDRQEERDP